MESSATIECDASLIVNASLSTWKSLREPSAQAAPRTPAVSDDQALKVNRCGRLVLVQQYIVHIHRFHNNCDFTWQNVTISSPIHPVEMRYFSSPSSNPLISVSVNGNDHQLLESF